MYGVLADLVVLLHFLFVTLAVLGGLLVVWRPGMLYLHLPVLAWAVVVEFLGLTCPLTPLENRLRQAAGSSAYDTDFIAHYLLPVLYPNGLTRGHQMVLGLLLILVNGCFYTWWIQKRRKLRRGVVERKIQGR